MAYIVYLLAVNLYHRCIFRLDLLSLRKMCFQCIVDLLFLLSSCLEAMESHSSYVHIYVIFTVIFFLYTTLSNTNNFWTDLFDNWRGLYQVQPFWLKVNLGVMAIKGYSKLSKFPELDPYISDADNAIQKIPYSRKYSPYILNPADRVQKSERKLVYSMRHQVIILHKIPLSKHLFYRWMITFSQWRFQMKIQFVSNKKLIDHIYEK